MLWSLLNDFTVIISVLAIISKILEDCFAFFCFFQFVPTWEGKFKIYISVFEYLNTIENMAQPHSQEKLDCGWCVDAMGSIKFVIFHLTVSTGYLCIAVWAQLSLFFL